MLTAFAILGVLAALFLAAALATRDGEGLAPVEPDAADLALPEGPMSADDVRGLRFGLAPRGYRMREVDAALARLAADLEDRDRRLAELEAAAQDRPAGPADVETVPVVTEPVDTAPGTTPVVVAEPATEAPVAPATDAAFSAADDLAFPEVSLPDVDDDAPAGPDLSVGQAPVEPVDPPLRSS